MSIKIMQEVWASSPVEQGSLLVLLALADSADEDSRTCYPGIATLSRKSRLKERQVQNCIKNLRDMGVIEVQRNASPLKTNVYKITEERCWNTARDAIIAPPPENPETQLLRVRDAMECVSDTQPSAPKPSVTSVIKPKEGLSDLFSEKSEQRKPDQTPELFERFWKEYPKKAGKPAALKAFTKAIKKTDPEQIIAGARKYATWLKTAKPGEFRPAVKYPQGWLNDERWNDDEIQGTGRPMTYAQKLLAGRAV